MATHDQIIIALEANTTIDLVFNLIEMFKETKVDPWTDIKVYPKLIFLISTRNPHFPSKIKNYCSILNYGLNKECLRALLKTKALSVFKRNSVDENAMMDLVLKNIQTDRDRYIQEIVALVMDYDLSQMSACLSVVENLQNIIDNYRTNVENVLDFVSASRNDNKFDEIIGFGIELYELIEKTRELFPYLYFTLSRFLQIHWHALEIVKYSNQIKGDFDSYKLFLTISVYREISQELTIDHKVPFGFALMMKILTYDGGDYDSILNYILSDFSSDGNDQSNSKVNNWNYYLSILSEQSSAPERIEMAIDEEFEHMHILEMLLNLQKSRPSQLHENISFCLNKFFKTPDHLQRCLKDYSVPRNNLLLVVRSSLRTPDKRIISEDLHGRKLVRFRLGTNEDLKELQTSCNELTKSKRKGEIKFLIIQDEWTMLNTMRKKPMLWIASVLNFCFLRNYRIEIYVSKTEFMCSIVRLLEKMILITALSFPDPIKIIVLFKDVEPYLSALNKIPKRFEDDQNEEFLIMDAIEKNIHQMITSHTNDSKRKMLYFALYLNIRYLDNLLHSQWFDLNYSEIHFKAILSNMHDVQDKFLLSKLEENLMKFVNCLQRSEVQNVIRTLLLKLIVMAESKSVENLLIDLPANHKNELNFKKCVLYRKNMRQLMSHRFQNAETISKIGRNAEIDMNQLLLDIDSIIVHQSEIVKGMESNTMDVKGIRQLFFKELLVFNGVLSVIRKQLFDALNKSNIEKILGFESSWSRALKIPNMEISEFRSHLKQRSHYLLDSINGKNKRCLQMKFLLNVRDFFNWLRHQVPQSHIAYSFKLIKHANNNQSAWKSINEINDNVSLTEKLSLGDLLSKELNMDSEEFKEISQFEDRNSKCDLVFMDSVDDNGQYFEIVDLYVQNAGFETQSGLLNRQGRLINVKIPKLYIKPVLLFDFLKAKKRQIAIPLNLFRTRQPFFHNDEFVDNEILLKMNVPCDFEFNRTSNWNVHLNEDGLMFKPTPNNHSVDNILKYRSIAWIYYQSDYIPFSELDYTRNKQTYDCRIHSRPQKRLYKEPFDFDNELESEIYSKSIAKQIDVPLEQRFLRPPLHYADYEVHIVPENDL
ncbi:hypothetical protein ACOME3_001032 [Neoechinorhynchus agilis]